MGPHLSDHNFIANNMLDRFTLYPFHQYRFGTIYKVIELLLLSGLLLIYFKLIISLATYESCIHWYYVLDQEFALRLPSSSTRGQSPERVTGCRKYDDCKISWLVSNAKNLGFN